MGRREVQGVGAPAGRREWHLLPEGAHLRRPVGLCLGDRRPDARHQPAALLSPRRQLRRGHGVHPRGEDRRRDRVRRLRHLGAGEGPGRVRRRGCEGQDRAGAEGLADNGPDAPRPVRAGASPRGSPAGRRQGRVGRGSHRQGQGDDGLREGRRPPSCSTTPTRRQPAGCSRWAGWARAARRSIRRRSRARSSTCRTWATTSSAGSCGATRRSRSGASPRGSPACAPTSRPGSRARRPPA